MVHGFMGPEPFRILRTQLFFKVSRDRRLWESLRVYGPQYLAQRETQKEHLKKTSKSSTKASRETKSQTLDERRLLSTTECLSKLIGLSRKVYDCHNTIVSIKERNLPMWSQIDFKAEQSQWIDDALVILAKTLRLPLGKTKAAPPDVQLQVIRTRSFCFLTFLSSAQAATATADP